MGNLLLCQKGPVPRPYYAPELGIHLYTAEELSYYIFNHVLLIDEDFADERLLDFLRQLGHFKLEERVRRLREQSGLFEVLYAILQDLRYYSSAELFAFRKQLEQLSKVSPSGRAKAKGDALFGRGQYYAAIRVYNQVLSMESRDLGNQDFAGRVWSNKGACYARMDQYEEAMECLKKAYALNRDPILPEKMIVLNRMMGNEEAPEFLKSVISPEALKGYESNWENRSKLSLYQGKALEAAAIKDKKEPERTREYLELLYRWKEEFRRGQIS